MKTCEPAIYQKIKTAVGHSRVYPLRAPQNATAPFIVYQRSNSDRWRSINNPSGIAQATMQIDVYAATFEEIRSISSTIEQSLDGFNGLVYYGTNSPQDFVEIGATLQDDFDTLDSTDEPLLYRNSATYTITYTQ